MKIGLVCPYNLMKGGGVQECVVALQAELTKRGHNALIVTPQPRQYDGDMPDFVRVLGRARDVKSPFHTTAQVSVSVDTKQVDELLQTEKFDVLHFHEPWIPLLSRQILTRSNARNVATFHAKLPDTVMSRTIERVITPYTKSVLKYLDALTAVSPAAAEYIESLTDRPIDIIPNGIDLAKYSTAVSATRKPKTIFYIGRLEKRKGLMYLLKAMADLQTTRPDVQLIIAGDGTGRAQLEKYAREHDIHATFLGRVDEATKLELLRTSALFCSPARYGESFGIVLLEAMATGLPIVAGDNPGYAGVMQGTGRLSLINPRQIDEFSRRLDLLMNDQPLRRVWQDWAAKEVPQYDYMTVVDQYEKLYHA